MSQSSSPEILPFTPDAGSQHYAPGLDCLDPGIISNDAFSVAASRRFLLPKMASGLYNHLKQICRMLCLLYTPRLKFQAAQHRPQNGLVQLGLMWRRIEPELTTFSRAATSSLNR